MQYCEKCRRVWEDTASRCAHCRNGKLRPAADRDEVLLQTADLYTAQRLEERLEEQGIPCRAAERTGAVPFYDSQAMPTDREIFVRYQDLAPAKAVSAALSQELAEEREQQSAEPEPPNARRIVGEIVSVTAFLLLVMLAVFGADAIANFLKNLFA